MTAKASDLMKALRNWLRTDAPGWAQEDFAALEACAKDAEDANASNFRLIAKVRADAEAAERRLAEHDVWCEYRKRLDLSFALGELSGAVKKA